MTRRENFLRALRRQPHDYLPAYFPIDNFNLPGGLPRGLIAPDRLAAYDNPEQIVEASRYLGLDAVVRITPSVLTSPNPPVVRDLGDGRQETVWQTPRGALRQMAETSQAGETRFIIEHPIREIQDYESLLALLESTMFEVSTTGVTESRRYLQTVRADGIAYAVGPATPIMDLIRTWVGLERFVYHLADEPGLVGTVLDAMAERAFQQYELIAEHTPCEVMVLWDDANSLSLSRKMFERYSLPVLRGYAEIAHRHGKLLVNHTCGKIDAFLDLYAQTGNDAIDWLTPPPTGDVEPRRAREVLGERMAIQMALLPAVLRYGSVQEVTAHAKGILSQGSTASSDGHGGFVLMAPTPNGTPAENVTAVVRVLADRGFPLNRSQEYGCIVEGL